MGLNDFINIGDKIKKIRKSHGLTQREMAKKLDIPYSTYSNYENNNRVPNSETLKKICDLLNISTYNLIADKYDPPNKAAYDYYKNNLKENKEHSDEKIMKQNSLVFNRISELLKKYKYSISVNCEITAPKMPNAIVTITNTSDILGTKGKSISIPYDKFISICYEITNDIGKYTKQLLLLFLFENNFIE